MEIFWANGYEGAHLTLLTAAMGINPPSFYAAFGSKEALFREAVERYAATVGAGGMRALEQTGDTVQAIRAMLLASVETAIAAPGAGGCLIILGDSNCRPENQRSRRLLMALRQVTIERIRQRLERGRREGDLPDELAAERLASFYATVMQGLSLQARDGASRQTLLDVVEAAMSALAREPMRG